MGFLNMVKPLDWYSKANQKDTSYFRALILSVCSLPGGCIIIVLAEATLNSHDFGF